MNGYLYYTNLRQLKDGEEYLYSLLKAKDLELLLKK